MKKVLIGIAIVLGIVCTITLGLLACYTITNNNAKDKKEKLNNEKVITLGDYEIIIEEEIRKDGSIYRSGTIKNTKTDKQWDMQAMQNDNQIFAVNPALNPGMGLYNEREGYVIEPAYNKISCYFHNTGEDYYICDDYTIFAQSENVTKLLDLKTGKVIVEAESISVLKDGYILVLNGKHIYKSKDGKELLKADYIGYNENIGFITFENNKLQVYDNKLNKISMPNIDKYNEITVPNQDNDHDLLLKININSNNYFEYSGTKYKGEKIILIKVASRNEELELKNSVYIIDNGELKILDKVKNVLEKCNDVADSYYLCSFEEENGKENNIVKLDDYEITVEEEKYNDGSISKYGTIKNTKTKEEWNIQSFENDNSIFVIFNSTTDDVLMGIYNQKEGYIIEPKYEDVSCSIHTDESYVKCNNNRALLDLGENIVGREKKAKLLDLKTGKIILEADSINELSNGNYITFENGEQVLYSSNIKELLRKEYIGYNKKIGYFTLDDDVVRLYTENLKENDITLVEGELYELTSYYKSWDPDSVLIYSNLENSEYVDYLKDNNKDNMKKVMFVDGPCFSDTSTFLIENNKKIPFCDCNVVKDDIGCF